MQEGLVISVSIWRKHLKFRSLELMALKEDVYCVISEENTALDVYWFSER